MASLPTTNKGWLELGNRYLLRHPMRTAPLVPERGEGIYLWDVEGRRFIDFQSGQLCVTLGHSHPEYVQALCDQAQKIIQTGSTFIAPSEVLLAKKMADIAPDPLQKSFFACTGSESNEMALRLVRKYTGRFEVIALMRGYHGQSYGSASITGRGGMLREGYGPMPTGAAFVPPPYAYRCQFCRDDACCNLGCAEAAEYVLDTATSGRPAAFFFEPLMSAAGQIVPSREWIQRMVEVCRSRDILMVADEALTCFGRTGRWFAFEHFDFVPDVVTCSKGLGGGVPLCAVLTSAEIADAAVERGFMPFSSHAGDPLLCATGLANLEIVDRDNLVENARRVGGLLHGQTQGPGERTGNRRRSPRPRPVSGSGTGDRQEEPRAQFLRCCHGDELLLRARPVASDRSDRGRRQPAESTVHGDFGFPRPAFHAADHCHRGADR